jgi:hypothetical protein
MTFRNTQLLLSWGGEAHPPRTMAPIACRYHRNPQNADGDGCIPPLPSIPILGACASNPALVSLVLAFRLELWHHFPGILQKGWCLHLHIIRPEYRRLTADRHNHVHNRR